MISRGLKMEEVSPKEPDRRAGQHESRGHRQQKRAHWVARTPPGWGNPLIGQHVHYRKRNRTQGCIVFATAPWIEQGVDDRVEAAHLEFCRFTRRRIDLAVGMQHFGECPVCPPDVLVRGMRREAQLLIVVHPSYPANVQRNR
jgi:hypothetical protein